MILYPAGTHPGAAALPSAPAPSPAPQCPDECRRCGNPDPGPRCRYCSPPFPPLTMAPGRPVFA